MKIVLIVVIVLIVLFAISQIFAMRSQIGIEKYTYTIEKIYGNFEVRNYEATLFTSVKLETGDFKKGSSQGFSILAGYIFGGNKDKQKISMTSPVSMSLEDSMTMMFMVPKALDKSKLPKPNQSAIQFKEEPAKQMAAITFGGWADGSIIEAYKNKLITALDKQGVKYTTHFYFYGYNAPYEVFNRKNEVVVELAN